MNKQDLTLLTDLYELTMMQGYFKGEGSRQSRCNLTSFTVPTLVIMAIPLQPGWIR